MQNFNLINDETIKLRSGVFGSLVSYRCYPTGELEGIKLSGKNMVLTHIGELVPFYTETERRKNKYSVEFYKNGMIKSVALEKQQPIYTAIGEFPSELVTFFDTGELKRFFPLDGKLSGFWTEEDEKSLHIPFQFDLGFTSFKVMINCVAFWKDGSIRSITLFPSETINVRTPVGEVETRVGFSIYQSGELESLEPASPVQVHTPIGLMTAFDPDASGVTADSNSLVFNKKGQLVQLVTSESRVDIQTEDGHLKVVEPKLMNNPLDDETVQREGMTVRFDYQKDVLHLKNSDGDHQFPLSKSGFTIEEVDNPYWSCSPSQCASCSLVSVCFRDRVE